MLGNDSLEFSQGQSAQEYSKQQQQTACRHTHSGSISCLSKNDNRFSLIRAAAAWKLTLGHEKRKKNAIKVMARFLKPLEDELRDVFEKYHAG